MKHSVEFKRIIGRTAIDVDLVLNADNQKTVLKSASTLSEKETADLKRIMAAPGIVNLFNEVGAYICPRKICPGLIQPGPETMIGQAILDPTFLPKFLADPVAAAAEVPVTLTASDQQTLTTLMATVDHAKLRTLIENLATAIQTTLSVMVKAAGKVA